MLLKLRYDSAQVNRQTIACPQTQHPAAIMKTTKQILLAVLILFLFLASGCSKNLFQHGDPESDPRFLGTVNDLDGIEEGFDTADSSSGSGGKPESGQSLDATDEGIPGGGSGSFKEEKVSEVDPSLSLHEQPASPRDFGSAEQGMPGDGSTGSFSADAFDGDRGGQGDGFAADDSGASPEPGSGFIREESVGEEDIFSGLPEQSASPRDFGSAEQGMPGDGSTGSFSADAFDGDRGGQGNGFAADDSGASPEPFLTQPGEDQVASLPQEEDALRLMPFRSSNGLQNIHFAFDKYDLDDNSRAILQKNVAYLKSYSKIKIEIQGHCDERGSNSYNLSLGERRAQSTKAYLVSLGIDENRIRTISYGEERPACILSNELCWYQNRRAHFLVAEEAESLTPPLN